MWKHAKEMEMFFGETLFFLLEEKFDPSRCLCLRGTAVMVTCRGWRRMCGCGCGYENGNGEGYGYGLEMEMDWGWRWIWIGDGYGNGSQ
jgi:hypothetical protein